MEESASRAIARPNNRPSGDFNEADLTNPNTRADYAALSAAYGSLLTRSPSGHRSAFALAQTLVHDKIKVWLRSPFLTETGSSQQNAKHHPRGSGIRFALGELLSCSRCSGAWAALALTGLQTVSPAAVQVTTRTLAFAGLNDLLESGFVWARTSTIRRDQPRHRRT
jgi:hypothetical protein